MSGTLISKNFSQFVVIHTVKGSSEINEAEVDVFFVCVCVLFFFFLIPYFVESMIQQMLAI